MSEASTAPITPTTSKASWRKVAIDIVTDYADTVRRLENLERAVAGAGISVNRKPGRPAKPKAAPVQAPGAPIAGAPVPKKRGRPPKNRTLEGAPALN